jgi:hypothetical protein
MELKTLAQDTIWNLDFETAWSICKAHNEFKHMSKQAIQRSRPSYPNMKVWDLYKTDSLTPEEKSKIGIK